MKFGEPPRAGFTLLEAAVAMTIVGLIGVGSLAAFGADLRAATRSQQLLPAAALAQERMQMLELLDAQKVRMLPDSIAHGTFLPPFEPYHWESVAKEVRGEVALLEFVVTVRWDDGAFTLSERRYRPQLSAVGGRQ